MKKFLCMVLSFMMALSLCACGSSDQAATGTQGTAAPGETTAVRKAEGLQVGWGRVDITPQYSVPLSGYGNTSMRMSTGFETYLYTTCVAFSDGENTVLLFHNDLTYVNENLTGNVRKKINEQYGIPEENIMVAATHNHSAPDFANANEPTATQYSQDLIKWLTKAAGQALEDMAPVTGMYHGEAFPEGLNFTRHYTTEAGVYKGDNFNDLCNSPVTGHTHKADNQLQLIKITRDGADDVVLINWQTHPHRGGGSQNTAITADLVGIMMQEMESKTGCKTAYYTGAAGNVNSSSRIGEENITPNYKEQGKALAKHALSILEGEMTEIPTGKVAVTTKTYTGRVNHSEDHLLNAAYEVNELWKETNDFIRCVTLANTYGINSPYHAGSIISKSGMPSTKEMDIAAVSVGGIGFACAPYEMFDENGKYIKENSPFQVTFVLELCNGSTGYIPSEEGYKINCYEANTGPFEPGTGELVAQEYVDLLNSLYDAK